MSERNEREFYYPDPTVRIRVRTMACLVGMLLLLVAALGAHAAVAPTCSLTTVSQLKQVSPATLSLAFSSSNAATCTATSTGNQTAWTGSKSVSGTQTLTGIKQSADYIFACAGTPLSVGSVLFTWEPPTMKSDGTTLDDLAGYVFYAGPSSGAVQTTKKRVADPTLSVYTLDSLPPGPTYFAMAAYSTVGDGAMSTPILTKTVTVPAPLTCSQTVHIDVAPVPAAPNKVTVDVVAYEINKSTDALALNAVGTVALGVSCKPEYDANGLNVVPRSAVTFKTSTRPLVVVAKCG
jgi:hypothetical protein